MPLVLAPQTVERTKAVQGTTPWVWLWQIVQDVTTLSTPTLPLVLYPKPLTHDGVTYYPFPVQPGDISMDAETLPSLSLKVANVYKTVAHKLHEGRGFIGNQVDLRIIPLDLLDVAPGANPYYIDWTFHIASAGANAEEIVFQCETPNFFERQYPEQRFSPSRCGRRFGVAKSGCPYVISSAAAFTDCPKLVEACAERGADMEARGYPAGLLPEAFGAYPGTETRS